MSPVMLIKPTRFSRKGGFPEPDRMVSVGTLCEFVPAGSKTGRKDYTQRLFIRGDAHWQTTNHVMEGQDYRRLSPLEALALAAE